MQSLFLLLPNKQLEHLNFVFRHNKAAIEVYFLFHYLPLDNSQVNYFVVMREREAWSQSLSKWEVEGTNTKRL